MALEDNSFFPTRNPRFDGHYDHGSMLMENFLICKEYWDLIENGIAKPVEGVVLIDAQMKVVDNQKLKDLKEKNYLVPGNRSYHPGNHPQEGHYQRDIGLHEKEISRHDKGQTTLSVAKKMRIPGEKIGDVAVIEKLLRSMTSKFDYVKYPLGEAEDVVAFEEEEEVEEHCLTRQVWNAIIVISLAISNMNAEEEMLLITSKKRRLGDTWYLDSSCSNHMSGNKLLFSDLNETFRENVKLGNNTSICVMGEGNIKILMNNNMHTITSVLYVPALKDNNSNWSRISNESVLDLDANDESRTEQEEQSPGGRLSDVPSNELAEIGSPIIDDQRPRKRQHWMTNYVSVDELYDDEIIAYRALFAYSYPIVFNDVVKNLKWSKAMDAEIEAIKKN
ncbi:PREDICTED: Retrovirus-related Pol poly from transposon [Prunus dulcis]|uniref:PREDICTED: Retrovirus-related Pol poly from transposon n=1 Tax=Prunus dulcis TaxID=3755 RepID=A0A5E4G4R0_PRUDU|nr:PREDICTED: Retrovirus-related Pol poly from transposon [Prunus dulcis]